MLKSKLTTKNIILCALIAGIFGGSVFANSTEYFYSHKYYICDAVYSIKNSSPDNIWLFFRLLKYELKFYAPILICSLLPIKKTVLGIYELIQGLCISVLVCVMSMIFGIFGILPAFILVFPHFFLNIYAGITITFEYLHKKVIYLVIIALLQTIFLCFITYNLLYIYLNNI